MHPAGVLVLSRGKEMKSLRYERLTMGDRTLRALVIESELLQRVVDMC